MSRHANGCENVDDNISTASGQTTPDPVVELWLLSLLSPMADVIFVPNATPLYRKCVIQHQVQR